MPNPKALAVKNSKLVQLEHPVKPMTSNHPIGSHLMSAQGRLNSSHANHPATV